jgi:hypothetical protein
MQFCAQLCAFPKCAPKPFSRIFEIKFIVGVIPIFFLEITAANELANVEAAGVEFIDENGGGPGVRLRKRQGPKQPK